MQEPYTLDINTILHTKDGSKIGNAIVVSRKGYNWIVKTDYGNECAFTQEEIYEIFNIAWADYVKETHGFSCAEMQYMMQQDHKHRTII